ncbi:hypothetical protein BDD43_0485 [Mucilaginibacter gracilis]|uniref:Uncharacterized protein n=1 Tax=Mucilaginibacter gracilis TaxID=423350 RepID=A0A495IUY6_9SPHI|nr:hypothetical protein BDD43_0485 [Mucilaginibacter gracilis]
MKHRSIASIARKNDEKLYLSVQIEMLYHIYYKIQIMQKHQR